MPPVLLDLRSTDDARDCIHRAVQALVEGHLVAFPTETAYVLAASALQPEAVARLVTAGTDEGEPVAALSVRSDGEALDYVPNAPLLARRLMRRCWPGPVVLIIDDRDNESLLVQLAAEVRQAVVTAGAVRLRVPAHPVVHDILRLLAGPLVLRRISTPDEPDAFTARQALDALVDKVQLVLDGGRSRFAQPSTVVRVGAETFEIVRPGVVSEMTLKRLASTMVVFVCTGNTCRSPMAEVMFRQMVAARFGCKPSEVEDRGVLVQSAGLAAMAGGRPSPEAVAYMAQNGLNLADHASQPLTEQLVVQADLLIAMTRSHQAAIVAQWPQAADRVKLLCHDGTDVSDPIGGPAEVYARCAEQIKAELEGWINAISI